MCLEKRRETGELKLTLAKFHSSSAISFIMKNEPQTAPISKLLHGANIKYHKRDLLALLAACATLLMPDVETIGQDTFKWPTWTEWTDG